MNSLNQNTKIISNLPIKKRYRETFEDKEKKRQNLRIENVFSINDGNFYGMRKKMCFEWNKEAEKESEEVKHGLNTDQGVISSSKHVQEVEEALDEYQHQVSTNHQQKDSKITSKPKIWRPFDDFETSEPIKNDNLIEIQVLDTNLTQNTKEIVENYQEISKSPETIKAKENFPKPLENWPPKMKSVVKKSLKNSEKQLIEKLNQKYLKRLVHRARQQRQDVLMFRTYNCSACNLLTFVKKIADHHAKSCCNSEIKTSLEVKKILFK